jgi:hypothetical protein
MDDAAVEIKYSTARRYLGELLDDWAEAHGYLVGRGRGLRLRHDYAVRYYKSTYDGKPCIDVDWSAIDNIFVRE